MSDWKKVLSEVKKTYFSGESVFADEDGVRPQWNDPQWYLETIREGLKLLIGNGDDPAVQARVLYMIKTQFLVNMAGRNKGVLTGEMLDEYLGLCRSCLRYVSNDLISGEESMPAAWRLLRMQWCALMRLKYESDAGELRQMEIRDGRLYCQDAAAGISAGTSAGTSAGKSVSASAGKAIAINETPGFLPVVVLDLMEVQESLHIDFSIDRFVMDAGVSLEVRLDGISQEIRQVPRMAGTGFFGRKIADRRAMALEIPLKNLNKNQNKNSVLQFVLKDEAGNELIVPIVTVDYQSRLSGFLRNSYWCFEGKMAVFRRDSDGWADAILFEQAGLCQKISREAKLLKEILRAPYGSKQMFLVRGLYWLSYPMYAGKKIWITFDKLYKGGDCGEYFYKYMTTRKKDGITPLYVIRKDAADYERLKKEGYHPSVYRSLRQRLSYLYADVIFATHSSVHSFCGFSKWEIRFVQDLLKSVNTCIQHGLSVQDLTADSHRVLNNNKRYYCASHCEIENLSKPEYDYPEGVLKLTGIPRYDGLVNQDRRQILITPTWRSYIAMPSVMGTARGYNPEFKHTEYYRIFQELLENKELSEMAKRTGYKVIYLLHPVISAQKQDFQPGEGVELVSAMEADYEQLLTQSSLMVTDYSGVQFDFAYMRKPVVYFHPPKLPPHYEDGGFCYETQGFGEICTEPEELVQTLCRYMESDCRLTLFYRERQNAFFAFDDHESCRRIFEDALNL